MIALALRAESALALVLIGSVMPGLSSMAKAQEDERAGSELLALGSELIELGRYEQAEEILSKAADLDPGSAAIHGALGRSQALNRRWLKAESSLSKARDLGQRDLRTLVYLGSAYWENTKFEESETVYSEAVERFPSSPLPKYQLGRLLLWQGRYGEAVPLLRQSAARNPSPDVLFDLAEALRGASEVDAAIVAYQKVTRAAPDLMKAHYGLALLLNQSGRSEDAQREMKAYYELYQADQVAARAGELERGEIDRGRDLMRQQKTAEAIEHLDSLPATIESLTVLAEAYLQAGQPERTIETLERAVIMDPGNSELRQRLAEARLAENSGGS